MFVLLLGLVAVASAAPYYARISSPYYQNELRSPIFNADIFDTRQFWSDLSTELRQMDTMLQEFYKHFPRTSSQAGVVGREYVITIPLSGFEEKDIVVKAREGLLMVQAVHNYEGGSVKNYLDVRMLPACVNVTGNWIFQDNVLKITFPLKEGVETPTEPNDTHPTEAPRDSSREEIETATNNNIQDADVGATRGDKNKESNNEIFNYSVEATTYAVDLKDDIEFVPVNYNRN